MRTSPKMIYTQLAVPAWPINPAEPIDGSLSSPPTRNCIHRKHNEFPKSSMNPGESEDGGSDKFRYPTSYIRTPNPEQRGPELPSPELCRTPRSARGINLIQVVVVLSPQREGSSKDTGPLLKRKLAQKFRHSLGEGVLFQGLLGRRRVRV